MFTKFIKRVNDIGLNPRNGFVVIKSIGKSIWIKNSVLKIAQKLGLFLSIIKLNNSKRIKSEESLVESETRYRRLFESAKDGILILDAESGKIDDVNPYLIELLGYSKESFIQKRIWELGLFKDIIENKEKFLELQQLEYVRYDDLPLKTSDGRKIHVEFVSNVYLVNGKKVIQCNIRNITERKNAFEKVVKSEIRFRTLFDPSPIAIALLNMDGRIVNANSTWSELVGYSTDELSIMKFTEFTFHEDIENDMNRFTDLISGKISSYRMEKRFVHRNGNLVWVNLFVSMLYDEKGLPSEILGMAEDTTAQKQIQKEIKFQSDLLNNVGQAVIATDLHGEVIYWNMAAEQIYGWSSAEAIGQNIVNLTPAQQSQEQAVELMQELSEGKSWSGEFMVKGKEGNSFPCYVTDTPIFDSLGILIGIIGISSDLTARKLAEEKLIETEGKFRSYIEHSPVGIFIVDETGRYLDCNPAAQNMLGYTCEEILNLSIIDSLPLEEREKGLQNFNLVTEIGFAKVEIELLRKDGGRVPVLLESVRLPQKNRFMAFCTDITERKITEQELLISKDKAEESDKLKTAFLQNMSHEIRTPLNGIIGFSSLLNSPDLSADDIAEFTEMISISGNRLIEIVNNILDISKIQTGQVNIEKKVVVINSIFSDILTFFSHFTKEKNLIMNYTNQNDHNRTLFTDETKLNQILTNLVNNAVKFTKTGSIDFGYEIKDNDIEFFVRDTGIGILPEMQNQIFDRFIQAENSVSRGYEGAGLGLAICRGLVELLGGKIWVVSEFGKGTTFYFTLPYDPTTQNYIAESILPKIVEKKVRGKILIAEDDWISSQYLRRILVNSGVVVIHAENGQQAVEITRNTPDIDLILMDIRMPVMDGIDATKLIKKFRPDIPIIAQTAYAFASERKKILEIGCDEYLTKPIEEHKLKAMLNKYMN